MVCSGCQPTNILSTLNGGIEVCDNGDWGDVDASYDYLDIDTDIEPETDDHLGIDELTKGDIDDY